jgi:hypothetical protein
MTTAAAVESRGISGSEQALTYAISAIARSGATRSAYVSSLPMIYIGGIWTGPGTGMRVLIASLSIRDALNEQPNTCTFTVQGTRPADGADVVIQLGSVRADRIFAGNIVRTTEVYSGKPQNILWQVEAVDYTWHLNGRRVNRRYRSMNAVTILADLAASFAPPGFTAAAIGLPDVDEISFTDVPLMDAVAQLALRIGGYALCDYHKVIRMFLASPYQNPQPLTPSHPSLESISVTSDLSQLVTRAIVIGGGVNATAEVSPGGNRIPVVDVAWYNAKGGRFVSGPQRCLYGGIVVGGEGAMIGTGAVATPTTAPTIVPTTGAALPAGTYQYAYTWQTAAGETLPSPIASAPTAQIPDPTVAPTMGYQPIDDYYNGSLVPGGNYRWKYAYATSREWPPLQVTKASPSGGWQASNYGYGAVQIPVPAYDPALSAIFVYRTTNNGTIYYLESSWNLDPGWSPGGYLNQHSTESDGWLVQQTREPTANTTNANKGQSLAAIAPGPGGTTARRIYRTAKNSAQLRLHSTLANNSATTTPLDTVADAALGANAPTTNTAGLVITTGIVLAGATTIPVSTVLPFGSAGWAEVENMLIRYTGVGAGVLTGVPSTGPGSLEASVNTGTPITVAPQLTGIPASGAGAIALTIQQGDPVNLMVQVDDAAAQTWLAGARGGDGIAEGVLTDNRISEAEANARAASLLQQNAKPLESLRYRTRDRATRSGSEITVDLPPPFNVTGKTFRIQDVTISGFLGTATPPTFDASASSQRFSFEDLLRRQRTKAQV